MNSMSVHVQRLDDAEGDVAGMGPWVGHSWPRQGSGMNWMSALREGGCAPGINLHGDGRARSGATIRSEPAAATAAFYCFALVP